MTPSNENTIALFKGHSRTDPSTLVMHSQRYSLRELSHTYYESAQTIASRFDGSALSDIFLLPYLFLIRQAFELLLKDGIFTLKELHIEHFRANPEELYGNKSPAEYLRIIGHDLKKLVKTFKKDFSSFNFPEKFPTEIETVVLLLHHADKSGTEFRYGTQPQEYPAYIDSKSLCSELHNQFHKLELVIDYAHGTCSYLPTDRYKKPDSDKPIKEALIDEDE